MFLRGCPFCGLDARIRKTHNFYWVIECSNEDSCCSIKPNQLESEAVRKWNKRKQQKGPPKDFIRRMEALYDADSIMNALDTVARMSRLWKEKYGTK